MFTKNLPKLVSNVLEKEQKIQNRIELLKSEIAEIQTNIKEQTKQLMDAELADDENSQKECEKEIRSLKNKMERTKELLSVYQDELEKNQLDDKDAEAIKKATLKEVEAKTKKLQTFAAEKRNLEDQITALQEQLESKELEYSRLHASNQPFDELKKIIRFIEPNYKKIRHGFERNYLNDWIYDGPKEQHFDDPQLQVVPDIGPKQPKYVEEKPNPVRTIDSFTKREPLEFINHWEQQFPEREIINSDYQKVEDGRYAVSIQWKMKKEYL